MKNYLYLCLLIFTAGISLFIPRVSNATITFSQDTILTSDIGEDVVIANDNITLDCNGHTIYRSGNIDLRTTGIRLQNHEGVTIKNCTIKFFFDAIGLYDSKFNKLFHNSLRFNYDHGVFLHQSDFNEIEGNEFYSDNVAIEFANRGSNHNLVSNNHFVANNTAVLNAGSNYNSYLDNIFESNIQALGIQTARNLSLSGNRFVNSSTSLSISGYTVEDFIHEIDSSNTIDAKPIYYLINENNKTISSDAGFIGIVNSSSIIVKDLKIKANTGTGILLVKANNSLITNVEITTGKFGGNTGVYLLNSDNNRIENSRIYDNALGIRLINSSSNEINFNDVLGSSSGVLLSDLSSDNRIYNNNFISNTFPASLFNSTGSILNLERPTGGNYWDSYDEVVEGCVDSNDDHFCDSPYVVIGTQDNLPWNIRDGWLISPQMIKPTEDGKLKCGFGCYPSHEGVDVDKTLYQKPVRAVAGGMIVKVDAVDDSKAGKWVWISHGDISKLDGTSVEKISTRYLHLDAIDSLIEEGDIISQGTIIGTAGQTGATVPHLHFEVRQGDIPQNLDFHLTTALNPLDFVTYPRPGFSASAFSPVDIVVTDPDGLVVSKTANDLQDSADYFEVDYAGSDIDGEVKGYEVVTIDELKVGDYLIEVVPEPEATPDETYTLKITSDSATVILGEDVAIQDTPAEPYVVRSDGTIIERVIPVKVEIEPETINLDNKGIVIASIRFPRGSGVPIKDVDLTTIKLEGAVPSRIEANKKEVIAKFKESNLLNLSPADKVNLKLTGKLLSGIAFEGVDTVHIIQKGKPR